jgi:ABC-type amino acid transport substrate-binding protein
MLRATRPWFLFGAALACASPVHADLKELKARGSIRVIAAQDEQPEMFSFVAGQAPGFEREMAEGFAKLHGLKLEVAQVRSANDRIPALRKGEGDFIIGTINTEERRKLVDFTVEVIPARHLVVTYKPHRVVRTVEEFLQEQIGLSKGTSWATTAYEAGVSPDKAELFVGTDTLLDALRDGKISASVMTISDFTLAVRRYPGLQGGVFIGPANQAAWAIRKEDAQLEAALNEYLDNLRKGPSWSRLIVKYFGDQALAVLGRGKQ